MTQITLDPNKATTLELPNSSWVFILNVLKQLPAGTISDNGQEGLITLFNNKLIEANNRQEPNPDEQVQD